MKHIFLDLQGPAAPLGSEEVIYGFLRYMPGEIGMRRLREPKVVKVEDEENSGVTGFVIIVESHISIHTWPEKGRAYVDIFSCKDFDEGVATEKVCKLLGGAEVIRSGEVLRNPL